MFVQVTGRDLTDLWFNLLVHIATGRQSEFQNPSIHCRRVYGSTSSVMFKNKSMVKDFYRYSEYNKDIKLARLRESYFSRKVEKQFEVLLSIARKLQPRQARGMITFSEPAFNDKDRLKCLDNFYIQKTTMTKADALIIFRNTEIWPKTFMDFVFLYELISKVAEQGVKITQFDAFLTSSFINMYQVPTAAMLLRKYGITHWNEHFKQSLIKWQERFEEVDPKSLSMQWIKRIVDRTQRLMKEDGVNLEMLINGE